MTEFFLKAFDRFRSHPKRMFSLLAILCALLTASALTLEHNENILDFLPVDRTHRKAMNIYRNLSAAEQIIAIVQPSDTVEADPSILTAAADSFASYVEKLDTLGTAREITTSIGYSDILEVSDFICANIPYFLTEEDYCRLDTLLTPDYVARQISADRQMLMFPTGSVMSGHIRQDPLNLFTPVLQKLQVYSTSAAYELYDGHIFTPGLGKALAMTDSPYGSNETRNNAKLVDLLDEAADSTRHHFPETEIHLSGAPVYAVTNARRIKADSLISITVSIVLILILLLSVFRTLRPLFHIGASVFFGWLFAMGLMGVVRDEVSMIILGIASIIIGIAVNYPIHLIDHLRHGTDIKSVLKEIISPLVVGNITTVGAFLCLVPMTAPALRDFGLFAALMLVGTIAFVLVFLPHLLDNRHLPLKNPQTPQVTQTASLSGESMPDPAEKSRREPQEENGAGKILSRIAGKPALAVLAACTIVFAYFSRSASFDSDLHSVNYMTAEQKADLASLQSLLEPDALTPVYVASEGETWDEALAKSGRASGILASIAEESGGHLRSAAPFLPSKEEQTRRLGLWRDFTENHREELVDVFGRELAANGFNQDAFGEFSSLIDKEFPLKEWEDFSILTSTLFLSCLSSDEGLCTVIDYIDVAPDRVAALKTRLSEAAPEQYCFDVQGMNGALTSSLSDDFNRTCWSCGIIVFIFLWLSFGRIELSIIAFLPMAVSWLWILGIMQLTGIRFNIVNVILATFIFGQGDDYTIFIADGLISERTYGRKLLKSYKHSILLSALIMLVGIGSLILAKHPAMRSLAQVTIIGMSAVVLMACLIPPFCFDLLTKDRNGGQRVAPVTVAGIFRTLIFNSKLALRALGAMCLRLHSKPGSPRMLEYAAVASSSLLGLDEAAPVPPEGGNLVTDFNSPMDALALLACGGGSLVLVTDRKLPFAFRSLLRASGALSSRPLPGIPAGFFADEAGTAPLPAHPLAVHGTSYILPGDDWLVRKGRVSLRIGKEVLSAQEFKAELAAIGEDLRREKETADFLKPYILDRYRYKGREIEREARRLLSSEAFISSLPSRPDQGKEITVRNNGTGVPGLLLALIHRDLTVHAFEKDPDRFAVSVNLAGLPSNLVLHGPEEADG